MLLRPQAGLLITQAQRIFVNTVCVCLSWSWDVCVGPFHGFRLDGRCGSLPVNIFFVCFLLGLKKKIIMFCFFVYLFRFN